MEIEFLDEAESSDDWRCYVQAFNENLLLTLEQLDVMGTECALVGDHTAAQFLAGIRAALCEFARIHLQEVTAPRDRQASVIAP